MDENNILPVPNVGWYYPDIREAIMSEPVLYEISPRDFGVWFVQKEEKEKVNWKREGF